MTKTTRALGLTALCAFGLAGCELIGDVLSNLDDLTLLGVMPAPGFSDASSRDEGKVTFAMGGRAGETIVKPVLGAIEVEDEDGNEVPIEGGEERPGFDTGSFVLLVDGTGSMENTGTGCEGCPTDPTRQRVAAAQTLAKHLNSCGPDWRQSLMEFSTTVTPNSEFTYTRVLSGFDADFEDLIAASSNMTSDGGTPLWDATSEVLENLLVDTVEQFGDRPKDDGNVKDPSDDGSTADPNSYGVGLVVISDGDDTGSFTSLDTLIARAVEAGVPIHAIGLGPASDAVVEFSTETTAIANLRRLASETGGYYGYVANPDELPALAQSIAEATCGGYTEVVARFEQAKAPGERVNGKIRLKNTSIALPYTFTAP